MILGMQVAGQQAVRAKEAQERTVVTKLDKVKTDQARRAEALAKEAEEAELRVGEMAFWALIMGIWPIICMQWLGALGDGCRHLLCSEIQRSGTPLLEPSHLRGTLLHPGMQHWTSTTGLTERNDPSLGNIPRCLAAGSPSGDSMYSSVILSDGGKQHSTQFM